MIYQVSILIQNLSVTVSVHEITNFGDDNLTSYIHVINIIKYKNFSDMIQWFLIYMDQDKSNDFDPTMDLYRVVSNLVKMLDACPYLFLVFVFHCFWYFWVIFFGNMYGAKNTIIISILVYYLCFYFITQLHFYFISQNCQIKINLWHMELFFYIFSLESPSAIGVDRALCVYVWRVI